MPSDSKKKRLVWRTEHGEAVLCLPSSTAPSASPSPHLQGKETTERILEAKWASDSVRAAQALRRAASCTSATSGPQTAWPAGGESRDKLRKVPSPREGDEHWVSGSASASSHRIRTVYVN